MIYTVTINPSIDYLLTVDQFQLGETNRASAQKLLPGGKGINVSRVLHSFGNESEAMGFTAGFTGEFLKEELVKEGIRCNFINTEGQTRINVKLKTDTETEINGSAPEITEGNISSLLKNLDNLNGEDTLVLSGSLPASLPPDLYKSIINRVNTKGVRVYADTSGKPLRELLPTEPFLIKPNQEELANLYNEDIYDTFTAVKAAKKAVKEGAQHVLVSLGGEGAVLVTEKMVLTAHVPKGKVLNSVGAGDSMVAGFIHAYGKNADTKEAFQFSVASGSATAFSEGLCTKGEAESLFQEIAIREL